MEQEIEEDGDDDEECMHDVPGPGQGKGSIPGMVQPVCSFFTVGEDTGGAAVSQISATLALLVKALLPGILEAGTLLQVQQTRTPRSGVRVVERFALETPPRLSADSEEEKKALVNEQESNQVVNSAEDTPNALQSFRSISERHKPC